jgi:mevalonate kinase
MKMSKEARGSAYGKIILMGEHSVVYGKPAIAMPFKTVGVQATISQTDGPVNLVSDYYRGALNDSIDSIKGLVTVIKETVHFLNEDLNHFKIDIKSTIPAERGMGSSAAVSVATIRALFQYFNKPLDYHKLLALTHISEMINHGNPSGLDGVTTSSEKPIYYIKGEAIQSFPLKLRAYLVVADTGVKGQTKDAVFIIKQLMEHELDQTLKKINQLGQLTLDAYALLKMNKPIELGQTMLKAHRILDHLGVSNHQLNELVNEAVKAGALGAKLTGGGRGGCMIALVQGYDKAKEVEHALLNLGATQTWLMNLEVGHE